MRFECDELLCDPFIPKISFGWASFEDSIILPDSLPTGIPLGIGKNPSDSWLNEDRIQWIFVSSLRSKNGEWLSEPDNGLNNSKTVSLRLNAFPSSLRLLIIPLVSLISVGDHLAQLQSEPLWQPGSFPLLEHRNFYDSLWSILLRQKLYQGSLKIIYYWKMYTNKISFISNII